MRFELAIQSLAEIRSQGQTDFCIRFQQELNQLYCQPYTTAFDYSINSLTTVEWMMEDPLDRLFGKLELQNKTHIIQQRASSQYEIKGKQELDQIQVLAQDRQIMKKQSQKIEINIQTERARKDGCIKSQWSTIRKAPRYSQSLPHNQIQKAWENARESEVAHKGKPMAEVIKRIRAAYRHREDKLK